MPRPPILKPGETYTFSKYFELTFDPEDILAELGFRLERSLLNFPQHPGDISHLDLKYRIQQSLTYVDLTSESARREVLIAPVLLECGYTISGLYKILICIGSRLI